MTKILVTGASGQLGKSIQKMSLSFKDQKIVFTNSNTLDITNKEAVSKFFYENSFDYCINCAAYTNVEQAEVTPEIAFKVNSEAIQYLVENCLKQDVVLIHISTDYVFDGKKEEGYFATDPTNPINEYGKSKLAGEKIIQKDMKKYFIVRTSWLYSEFGHNFYKTILKKAKEEKILYITDKQTGQPTNSNNLAFYLLNIIAAKDDNYGIRHFTDKETMTWYEFALRILKEHELEGICRIERAGNYRTLAERPEYSILL